MDISHFHLQDLDHLRTPEPAKRDFHLALTKLQTGVRCVCSMDLTVVFGDNNVLKIGHI
jgi:hypothetical protein